MLSLTRLEDRLAPAGIPGWDGPVSEAGPFVGAGAGGGPRVRGNGLDFYAFEPSFRGGVRLAAADLTGDAVADVVAVPGPGGGPVVAAFDGATGRELWRRYAFEPSFRGGLGVAATGDAVVVSPAVGGGPVAARFDGTGALLDTTLYGDADGRDGLGVATEGQFTIALNGVRVDPNPLFPAGGLRLGGGYGLPGDPPGPGIRVGFGVPAVAGTLTGYVRDDAGTLYGLSNDHVLAGTLAPTLFDAPGADVWAAGGPHAGVTATRLPAGRTVRAADSALYRDDDGTPELAHVFAGADGRNRPLALAAPRGDDPAVGEPVYVFTRFGVVRGVVAETGLAAGVSGTPVVLLEQATVAGADAGDPPAVPGYSGSVVTDRLGRPVAQLWGGAVETGHAVVTAIRTVLREVSAALGRPVAWV